MVRYFTTASVLAFMTVESTFAFVIIPKPSTVMVASITSTSMVSRRDAMTSAVIAATSVMIPSPAFAASGPTAADLERIKIGYSQITYLLANFEKETTTCRDNGGECKRDANAVRKAMGLRSTTDPLFQIEKVFDKVKYMDNLDPDKLDAFFEAAEDWNSCMAMSNSMAFISQFGEYNPGGGKDEVLKYLEESRKQVILAEKALKTIMDALEISPS